jgi:hypothetical protein
MDSTASLCRAGDQRAAPFQSLAGCALVAWAAAAAAAESMPRRQWWQRQLGVSPLWLVLRKYAAVATAAAASWDQRAIAAALAAAGQQ